MNWNELNSAWRCQATQTMTTTDLASLKATFEHRRTRRSRRLISRNAFQAFTGVVTCAIFIWVALTSHTPRVPMAIALALEFAVTVFFITECLRIWSLRLAPEAPLLDKLNADIAELTYQRKLRLNVAKWYLAPIGVAVAVLLISKEVTTYGHQSPGQAMSVALFVLACTFLFPLANRLNRCEVRKQIEPQLAELETFRQDVLASGR